MSEQRRLEYGRKGHDACRIWRQRAESAEAKLAEALAREAMILAESGPDDLLGAYLNTMVADCGLIDRGQYLRDLFGDYQRKLSARAPSATLLLALARAAVHRNALKGQGVGYRQAVDEEDAAVDSALADPTCALVLRLDQNLQKEQGGE